MLTDSPDELSQPNLRARHSRTARAGLSLSLVPFISYIAFVCLHLYKDRIGDPELVRRMHSLHPYLILWPVVSFGVWIAAAIKTGYALREHHTRKIYPILSVLLLIVSIYPAIKRWVLFLR